MCAFFLLLGLEPKTYVALLLINIHSFIFFFFFFLFAFLLGHFRFSLLIVWPELRVWVEKLSSSNCVDRASWVSLFGLDRFIGRTACKSGTRQIELLVSIDCLA